MTRVPSLEARELAGRLQGPDAPRLLDVREPWEHALAHLPDALLVPLGNLEAGHGALDKNAEWVVYCHHGVRSYHACHFLLAMGFANVKNLAGGIEAWSLEADPTTPRY